MLGRVPAGARESVGRRKACSRHVSACTHHALHGPRRQAIINGLRDSVIQFQDNVDGISSRDVVEMMLMTQASAMAWQRPRNSQQRMQERTGFHTGVPWMVKSAIHSPPAVLRHAQGRGHDPREPRHLHAPHARERGRRHGPDPRRLRAGCCAQQQHGAHWLSRRGSHGRKLPQLMLVTRAHLPMQRSRWRGLAELPMSGL